MLKKILIKNFQSHAESCIEFDPGVTLLTGTSNNGKTVVLRALNWIINNRPTGDAYIRNGEDSCEVQLFTSKCEIRKVRGKKDNFYILTMGGEEVRFSSMGTTVPEEITNSLDIAPINIQQQLDPYFLVLESPGKVGSYFNSVMKLEEVQEVISHLTGHIRSESHDLVRLEEEKSDLDKELAFYQELDLVRFEKNVKAHEKLQQEIIDLQSYTHNLLKAKIDLYKVEEQLVEFPFHDVGVMLEESSGKQIDIAASSGVIVDLIDLITDIEDVNCSLSVLDITRIDQVQEGSVGLSSSVKECSRLVEDLDDLLEDLHNIEVYCVAHEESVKIVIEEKKELMLQLDTCPYCLHPLDEESKKNLLGVEE